MTHKIGFVGCGLLGMKQLEYLLIKPKWQVIGVVDISRMAHVRFQEKLYK